MGNDSPSVCTETRSHFVFLWSQGFQMVQANPPFATDSGLLREFLEDTCF